MNKQYRQELRWKNKINIEEANQRLTIAINKLQYCKDDLHFWKIRLNKLRKERRKLNKELKK